MPPIQLPLTLAQRHTNQQLFSDHYLNVTLPQRPEWKLLAHDAAQALAVAIIAIASAQEQTVRVRGTIGIGYDIANCRETTRR